MDSVKNGDCFDYNSACSGRPSNAARRCHRIKMMPVKEIAERVFYLPLTIANVYLVGRRGGGWTLVDASVAGDARLIREAAESLYGPGNSPTAIVLTHGHPDHAGSALELSNLWGAPILAHPLELPYLTGKSQYPPVDPTVGGFTAMLRRIVRHQPVHLGDRVHALDAPQVERAMPGWKWVHTPGHSPGHVAFFRRQDEILLAGDALTTMNLDSFWATVTKFRRVSGPPAPDTYDWIAAGESVKRLAELHPMTIAGGHGVPMTGDNAVVELAELAMDFRIPRKGRYVREPAVAGERGVVSLPAVPRDPLAGTAIGLGIAAAAGAIARQRKKKQARAGTPAQAS
jgi:glyoxylase-like metal-dependent hydrolase (beta-lactamase superfamily II)